MCFQYVTPARLAPSRLPHGVERLSPHRHPQPHHGRLFSRTSRIGLSSSTISTSHHNGRASHHLHAGQNPPFPSG
jgi:hypothetical protein